MTREEIIAEINSIFVEQFELDPAELTAEKKIYPLLRMKNSKNEKRNS